MGIRSLDFFRKVNTDLGETTSPVGGLLSIAAMILVTLMAINETKLYFQTDLHYSTVIDNDSKPYIHVYADIIVAAPCQVLSLDQQDEVGVHILDVSDTLRKVRLDKNRREIKSQLGEGIPNFRGSEEEILAVMDSIEAGEQCQFIGYFRVNKVPGNFHISYHARPPLVQTIAQRSQQIYSKMRLDHSINDLHFGDQAALTKILKKYPRAFQTYLNKWVSISKKSPEDIKQDYEYHLNALPARFEDPQTGNQEIFYKYSINEAVMSRSTMEMDSIYFRYQISPINMVYSFEQKSIYHFIVQLLAILGGVIAVIGMLNAVIQRLI